MRTLSIDKHLKLSLMYSRGAAFENIIVGAQGNFRTIGQVKYEERELVPIIDGPREIGKARVLSSEYNSLFDETTGRFKIVEVRSPL